MSNPRDLSSVPPMPKLGGEPSPSADLSTKAANVESGADKDKNQARNADAHLKEWNDRLRKIFLDNYAATDSLYRFSFREEGTLDHEGDAMMSTSVLGADLRPGRWNAVHHKSKNIFDIVVDEKGNVTTSPRATGKGYRAHEDSAKLAMEFLKQCGATSAELDIKNFRGYTEHQTYKMIRIYITAAINAGLGVTFGDVVKDAVNGLSLEWRDELLSLQRTANFASMGREQLVFRECATRLNSNDFVEVSDKLGAELAPVKDNPDAQLTVIDKYADRLEKLERELKRAKGQLQSYVKTVDDTCADEKTSDKDVDLLEQDIKKSQEGRDLLIELINRKEGEASKLRSKLQDELEILSPASKLTDRKVPEDKSSTLESGDVAAEAQTKADENNAVANTDEHGSTLEEGDVAAEAQTKADEKNPAASTDEHGSTLEDGDDVIADKQAKVDEKSAAAHTELGAGMADDDADKSAASSKEKPLESKLTDQQEKVAAELRDKLKPFTLSKEDEAKRKKDWEQLMSENSIEKLGTTLERKRGHQENQKKI